MRNQQQGWVALTALAASASVSYQANAGVIYTDVDSYSTSNLIPTLLDVNNDSQFDLSLNHLYTAFFNGSGMTHNGDLWAVGLWNNQVSAQGPLSFGELIDSSTAFTASNHMADYYRSNWLSCGFRSCSSGSSESTQGSWNDGMEAVSGYLGFSLFDEGENYFGWLDINMSATGRANISGFAYEDCAGVGIAAGSQQSACLASNDQILASEVPEPSTLALLALGAAGVGAMRRRKQTAN